MPNSPYGRGTQLLNWSQLNFIYDQTSLMLAREPRTTPSVRRQLLWPVSNIPINLTRVADAPALGGAIMASVVGGSYESLQEASESMVHVERRIHPDSIANEQYQFYFEKYCET